MFQHRTIVRSYVLPCGRLIGLVVIAGYWLTPTAIICSMGHDENHDTVQMSSRNNSTNGDGTQPTPTSSCFLNTPWGFHLVVGVLQRCSEVRLS